MKHTRIVLIGGGGQFAFGLTQGLVDLSQDLLAGAHVVLLDVSDEHLPFVREFGERVARELGAEITFETTTDQRRAFDGADYLLSQFGAGGHEMQELDERLPSRYGLQGNETVGIGGIFRTLRVVPVLQAMMADATELCPDAFFVNYTNPVQLVADAIQRISRVHVISVCDGPIELVDELAEFLDLAPSSLRIYTAGTNHAFWVMRFTVNGQDGYPLLRERLSQRSPEELRKRYEEMPELNHFVHGFDYHLADAYKQFLPGYRFTFQLRLFELYGLLPGPRYYPTYYFDQDAHIVEQQGADYVSMATFYEKQAIPYAYDNLERRVTEAVKDIQNTRPEDRGRGGDFGTGVIASIENDLRSEYVVNVTNNGAISNLPSQAIVEVAAVVGRTGASPFAVGPLPDPLLGLQQALVLSNRLAVDAALSGSRVDLLQAIVAHPLVNSIEAGEQCMNEMLRRQAAWLPQFHK